MKRIYCTFSGSMYDPTTERIVKDAPGFGVNEVRIYDDKWLMTTEYYRLNHWLWEVPADPAKQRRGFGWYCWKPYVILEEMERQLIWMNDPDLQPPDPPVILWTDADTYPTGDLRPLFDICHRDGGMMFFAAEGWKQGQSTKRSCMRAMACDTEDYRKAQHATARFALFEAGNWRAKQFLMEWLTYCLNPACVGLEPGPDEYPEYEEHRSDQSVLTNLVHRYGCRLYREADEFGDGTDRDRELYPTVFKQIWRSGRESLDGSKYRNV